MITDSDLEKMQPYELENLAKRAIRVMLKKINNIKVLPYTTNDLRLRT